MAYAYKGRIGIPARPRDSDAKKERIPTAELAAFLRVSAGRVNKWARSKGLLHSNSLGVGGHRFRWVTAWGAMQGIAHFRGLQGAKR